MAGGARSGAVMGVVPVVVVAALLGAGCAGRVDPPVTASAPAAATKLIADFGAGMGSAARGATTVPSNDPAQRAPDDDGGRLCAAASSMTTSISDLPVGVGSEPERLQPSAAASWFARFAREARTTLAPAAPASLGNDIAAVAVAAEQAASRLRSGAGASGVASSAIGAFAALVVPTLAEDYGDSVVVRYDNELAAWLAAPCGPKLLTQSMPLADFLRLGGTT